MQAVTSLPSFTSNVQVLRSIAKNRYFICSSFFAPIYFRDIRLLIFVCPLFSPHTLVPPKFPFPIIIFAIDYLILSSYLADFTPISYSTATDRNPTIGAEDVTDMTSFCRKQTEVTFDKSLRTQNTIIQNTRNQRKLIYLF